MLDLFTIFTKGGIVLYTKTNQAVRPSIMDQLITGYFAESRLSESQALIGTQKFHWLFANDLDLVFVVVYQKILQLSYIDELLTRLRDLFVDQFRSDILGIFQAPISKGEEETANIIYEFPKFDFDDVFNSTLRSIEHKYIEKAKAKAPRRFEDTKKYQNSLEAAKKSLGGNKASREKKNGNKGDEISNKAGSVKARVWDGQVNASKMKALDYSDQKAASDPEAINNLVNNEERGEYSSDGTYQVKDIDSPTQLGSGKEKPSNSLFKTLFDKLTGQHTINQEELEPIVQSMREHLINKNVANDIANELCNSVKLTIVGKKLNSFQSLQSAVNDALQESITQILTPANSLDLLRDIQQTNQTQSRPYTITFIGVNGVGKSTNLSKVCFWLLQNNKRVLIAACDTFRSGAVEQLGIHVKNLNQLKMAGDNKGEVSLFQRGYGKDASAIAMDAVNFASKNGFDVVLIDTAGRMQNNTSLMMSLAKLVTENQPDQIFFVGEALVGNEAIDQLSKFNQSLEDYSNAAQPRRIDGIILTKFDTIDDKVGAALSMSFTARAPIIFVGTGQTYTDLKKMSIAHIVSSLLRS